MFANSGGGKAGKTHTHTHCTNTTLSLFTQCCLPKLIYAQSNCANGNKTCISPCVCNSWWRGEGPEHGAPDVCVCVRVVKVSVQSVRRIWAGNSVLHFKHCLISFFYATNFENRDILCREFSLKTLDHVCQLKIKIIKS